MRILLVGEKVNLRNSNIPFDRRMGSGKFLHQALLNFSQAKYRFDFDNAIVNNKDNTNLIKKSKNYQVIVSLGNTSKRILDKLSIPSVKIEHPSFVKRFKSKLGIYKYFVEINNAIKKKNHPMFGKLRPISVRRKISKSLKGKRTGRRTALSLYSRNKRIIIRKQHNDRVLKLKRFYENRGYKTLADLQNGIRPDLIIRKGNKLIAIEVERCCDINSSKISNKLNNYKKINIFDDVKIEVLKEWGR